MIFDATKPWVRASHGLGKTALLDQLASGLGGVTRLPARQGLPFVTFEPLLDGVPEGHSLALARRLREQPGWWLLDGWDELDAESQGLLRTLGGLGTAARVIVTGRTAPAFPVELSLHLGPLAEADLAGLANAPQTAGLPVLVGAALRGEAPDLAPHLDALDPAARRVLGALALLEVSSLAVVRSALNLPLQTLSDILDGLHQAGLVEPDGQPRARHETLRWLDLRRLEGAQLAAALAAYLPPLAAYPLLARAHRDIPETELSGWVAASQAWAEALLARGAPQRAAETLRSLPLDGAGHTLLARALERAGRYAEALTALPDGEATVGWRSALLWRLGRPDEARAAAERALNGDTEARGQGFNTLGLLALSSGDYAQAETLFRRAGAQWFLLGDGERRADSLNNLGVARLGGGTASDQAFVTALEASEHYPVVRASVLLNSGLAHEKAGHFLAAEAAYLQAVDLGEQSGVLETVSRAWNNLGVLYFNAGRIAEAEAAYLQAAEAARASGEVRMLAVILGNLAELQDDPAALEEAIVLLEEGGHDDMLLDSRAQLAAFRDRSGVNGQP